MSFLFGLGAATTCRQIPNVAVPGTTLPPEYLCYLPRRVPVDPFERADTEARSAAARSRGADAYTVSLAISEELRAKRLASGQPDAIDQLEEAIGKRLTFVLREITPGVELDDWPLWELWRQPTPPPEVRAGYAGALSSPTEGWVRSQVVKPDRPWDTSAPTFVRWVPPYKERTATPDFTVVPMPSGAQRLVHRDGENLWASPFVAPELAQARFDAAFKAEDRQRFVTGVKRGWPLGVAVAAVVGIGAFVYYTWKKRKR